MTKTGNKFSVKIESNNIEIGAEAIPDILAENAKLPSPPLICIKILELVRRDNFTFQELAQIIGADPSLTAKLLKVANTPHYNRCGLVGSIEKAVAVLGVNLVKIVALSFVVYSEFQADGGNSLDIDLFWRKSLTSAVAAEQIAQLASGSNKNLFLIAMLQDIGILIMRNWRPDVYQEICKGALNGHSSLHQLESDHFGFDHQMLGAELFKSWNFPEELYQPVRYHHAGDTAPHGYHEVIEILEVANLLSSFYNENNDVDLLRRSRELLSTKFGTDACAADTLIEAVAHESNEMFSAFEISGENMKPLSRILQNANEELSCLYHSYEIMMLELKQAKEKAELLAKELHESNERYRDLIYRDALTQVYNYRYFQEALGSEIERSRRYGREFSLVLFDLDQFKKVNDTHGHLVGSQVLVDISGLVQRNVRCTDIFARLGGDEFGIILPETDVSSARLLAEQIRHTIEVSKKHAPVTISAGLTSYRADKLDWDKTMLFTKADEALYLAKNNGKNQVCIV